MIPIPCFSFFYLSLPSFLTHFFSLLLHSHYQILLALYFCFFFAVSSVHQNTITYYKQTLVSPR